MQIENKSVGTVVVIQVYEKRLNAKIAIEFKAHLLKTIANGDFNIVLDLNDVTFIDSSGLGAIVSGLKELGRRGDILLCGVHESVGQMFSLTRLDKVFKLYPTQNEAIRAFK